MATQRRWRAWAELEDPYVLKVIRDGLWVDLGDHPRSSPTSFARSGISDEATKLVGDLLLQGTIVQVDRRALYSISPLFLVEKKGTEQKRPTVNFKSLNRWIETT